MLEEFKNKKVAILTSGGDSQGMNAAIRSCGRMIISMGARAFCVKWGYQGLVDGEENIIEYQWNDFSQIIHVGGTILGSARCMDFMKKEGRQKACLNMAKLGINHLVIIGGDGSLTGADLFRKEWSSHLNELVKNGEINEIIRSEVGHLAIVGMVGSIDNDFCGTDMTIGTDSALHRIIECVDSIITTAESHKRAFIIEIMGRNSGYLALSGGLAVGADFVFIPENPSTENWKEILCSTVTSFRENGKKYTIILVAEGAQDIAGNAITSEMVKNVLSSCTNLEARVTVLGHIQRGGSPSAYDRILGSRQGIEAAINVLLSKANDKSYVICTQKNHISRVPLDECISKCNAIKEAYSKRNIDKVAELRGNSFIKSLELFKTLQNLIPSKCITPTQPSYKFGIVHSGAPSAGMDPCSRAIVILCLSKGHTVVGFRNGFEGVCNEDYIELSWKTVESWFGNGGSTLGASRYDIVHLIPKVANIFTKIGLNGLVIIGGIDSIFYLKALHDGRIEHESLRIPIIMVPATISNNIAMTNLSLGSDTTLNVIAQCCDSLRLSAHSSRRRIFVVETFGKKCGYLSTMSALSSAGDNAYSLQNPPSIYDLLKDIENFKEKFRKKYLDFGLLFFSNEFSPNYTIDTITQLLNEEGKPYFTGRKALIGHIQQGSKASPFDRFLASKFGIKVAEKLLDFLKDSSTTNKPLINSDSVCMIASTDTGFQFIDHQTVISATNVELRAPKSCWWFQLKGVLNILSHSSYSYRSVTIPEFVAIKSEEVLKKFD